MATAGQEPPEFERLKQIADPFLRRLYFVAILTKHLGQSSRPVIVGGHAVEFYTLGHYSTGDIDIVYPDAEALNRLLNSWAFQREGRHWRRADLGLYLEAPAESLTPQEASRLTEAEAEGLSVFLLGPEDVILDRLNSFVHCGYAEDGVWAEQILRTHADSLDWGYLRSASERDETAAALEEIRRRLEAERGKNG